eukprot:5677347-Prymnesium_polylepis.1
MAMVVFSAQLPLSTWQLVNCHGGIGGGAGCGGKFGLLRQDGGTKNSGMTEAPASSSPTLHPESFFFFSCSFRVRADGGAGARPRGAQKAEPTRRRTRKRNGRRGREADGR